MTALRPLAGGVVQAVSGMLPASRPTSWAAPGLSGYLAVNCYTLASDGQALIIDTGLAAHWDIVRVGLDAALAQASATSLIMTRREPDAIGSLPNIVARYGPRAVYCGGVISPIDFFERVDAASAALGLRSIAQTDIAWVQPGASVPVGAFSVEVLPTTLRVLPKNHLYEASSRTLFASDTWALLPQPDLETVCIVREYDERLSPDAIARDLSHRFEWLAGINTTPMQAEVSDLLAHRHIDRICPSYGCIIEGPALVAELLQNTMVALQALSSRPRVRRMEGFPADRVRSLLSQEQADAPFA